jgi:hypothetical protein
MGSGTGNPRWLFIGPVAVYVERGHSNRNRWVHAIDLVIIRSCAAQLGHLAGVCQLRLSDASKFISRGFVARTMSGPTGGARFRGRWPAPTGGESAYNSRESSQQSASGNERVESRCQAASAELGCSGSTRPSWLRELMSSLVKTLWRWYSTVRGLMISRVPISRLESPSRARRAT